MKLQNKKTGEIIDLQEIIHQKYQEHNYNSLAELNEEWEDYNPDWVTENILGHLRLIDKKLKALSDYLNINFEIKYDKENKNKCSLVVKERKVKK